MADFSDKIALVTGAGSGIGRAIAIELARAGAAVYLVARRASLIDEVASEMGANAIRFPADLTDDNDLRRLAEDVRKRGRLDFLVHSAAAFTRGNLETASVDELDHQYHTNVRAPYLLTQLVLPLMKPVKGQIVFINSTAGFSAGAGVSAYAATKHALKAIADSLRDEVNASGVRVMSVYPGRTDSPMQREVYRLEGKSNYDPGKLMQPKNVADVIVAALALPDTAEVTNLTVRPARK